MDQVSDIIAEYVEKRGKSQSEVARKLGISSQRLGQYVNGQRQPKADFFIKWKEVFKDDLLALTETNVSNEADIEAAHHRERHEEPLSLERQTIFNLSESQRKLADSVLISAKNIERMLTRLEVSSGASSQTSLADDPAFSGMMHLLAKVATGKKWSSEKEFLTLAMKELGAQQSQGSAGEETHSVTGKATRPDFLG